MNFILQTTSVTATNMGFLYQTATGGLEPEVKDQKAKRKCSHRDNDGHRPASPLCSRSHTASRPSHVKKTSEQMSK